MKFKQANTEEYEIPELAASEHHHGDLYAGTYSDLCSRFGFVPVLYRRGAAMPFSVQWVFEIEDGEHAGRLFTLYDWKERTSPRDETSTLFRFRVGAATPEISRAVVAQLFCDAFEASLDESTVIEEAEEGI